MLPTLTIIFVLGLVLGSYLTYFPLSIAIVLLACTAGCVWLERQHRLTSQQSNVLLACLFGGCLHWTLCASFTPHVLLQDSARVLPVRLTGTIVEAVRHAPGRVTAMVQVTGSDDPQLPIPFHLRLTWRDPDRDLHRGLQIRTRIHVHAPSGTLNPRGFDYAAYLDALGVDAVGSVSGAGVIEVLDPDREAPLHLFASLSREHLQHDPIAWGTDQLPCLTRDRDLELSE